MRARRVPHLPYSLTLWKSLCHTLLHPHYRTLAPSRTQKYARRTTRYSLAKISENFSNYSAWHYRSTLLPVVRPAEDSEGGGGGGANAVAPDALAEEFETVCISLFCLATVPLLAFQTAPLVLGEASVDMDGYSLAAHDFQHTHFMCHPRMSCDPPLFIHTRAHHTHAHTRAPCVGCISVLH